MQYDSCVDSQSRWCLFYSDDFLEYTQNLELIIIDGTFNSAPSQFYQLVTIQGYIFWKFVPLIFILMQEKSEEKYSEIFSFLKQKNIISPKIAISDF